MFPTLYLFFVQLSIIYRTLYFCMRSVQYAKASLCYCTSNELAKDRVGLSESVFMISVSILLLM